METIIKENKLEKLNLRNASLEKLNSINSLWKHGFYSDYTEILDKFLDKAILRRTRLDKLIRLKEISEKL